MSAKRSEWGCGCPILAFFARVVGFDVVGTPGCDIQPCPKTKPAEHSRGEAMNSISPAAKLSGLPPIFCL